MPLQALLERCDGLGVHFIGQQVLYLVTGNPIQFPFCLDSQTFTHAQVETFHQLFIRGFDFCLPGRRTQHATYILAGLGIGHRGIDPHPLVLPSHIGQVDRSLQAILSSSQVFADILHEQLVVPLEGIVLGLHRHTVRDMNQVIFFRHHTHHCLHDIFTQQTLQTQVIQA